MNEAQGDRLVNVINNFVELARDNKLKCFSQNQPQIPINEINLINYKKEIRLIGWKLLVGLIIIAIAIILK